MIASHMINVLVYIALMGFISVLYVIVVLYIDEEKNRQELLANQATELL